MTIQQRSYVVFRDDEDNYYAVPREALSNHRVRREWKAKLRQALNGDDVEGFVQTLAGVAATLPDAAADGASFQFLGIVSVDDPKLLEEWSVTLP